MPGFELFSVSAENGSSEALFAFSEESNRDAVSILRTLFVPISMDFIPDDKSSN